MKKLLVCCLVALGIFLFPVIAGAQQNRYALVIGNGNYNSIPKLPNPVNDATDIAAKLRSLGYQVELQTNVTNAAMGRSINSFVQRLAGNRDNEGFFWFAGHGVQIDGENYLLPVDVNDTDDVSVKYSSYPVNQLTDSLNKTARNKVNVVVLDACRNNPFRNSSGNTRSLSRGLSKIRDLPPDLFVIYSTAPGDVANDGEGKRNSPFAEAFMRNMDRSEDLQLVTRGITRDTMQLTNNKQSPYQEGRIISLDYYSLNPRKDQPAPAPVVQPVAPPVNPPPPVVNNMVRINGGTFMMGSPANEAGRNSNETQHQVTVSSFYMGRHEVTQKEYQEIMGINPSNFKEDNLPVEEVSWYDAIEYCNKRSQREGLIPAYTINGTNVTWNRSANGYRLPTEAEWEYACRAGTTTAYNTGASISDNTGWYSTNSGGTTHPVGQKPASAWGLYDMHGNVWEWCWDWSGSYPSGAQTDPMGASSGSSRVGRGGSWSHSGGGVRSASRANGTPSYRNNTLGFRLVRNG